MSESKPITFTINGIQAVFREEDGTWWADSGDMPGWTAVSHSFEHLKMLVDEAADYFREENQ